MLRRTLVEETIHVLCQPPRPPFAIRPVARHVPPFLSSASSSPAVRHVRSSRQGHNQSVLAVAHATNGCSSSDVGERHRHHELV